MSTFAEWQNPVDASTSLTALAAAGNLKIVQIINRQLMTLPTELRRCHQLEQLVMIYTKTQIIPEWTKEFSKLKYFHIEGDRTPKRLDSLPAGLFSGMPNLLFVHLGALVDVPFVPELSHLRRLKYLTLAVLSSVTEFPSFDGLISLEQLNIVDAIQVHSLPSITGLRKLETVTLSAREPVCCNGFITGVCDLTDFSCLDRTASGERPVVCSTTRMSQEDQDILAEKGELVCEKNLMYDLKLVQQTFASIDEACGGVMYAKCSLRGITGMCFPSRLTPIGCQVNPSYQAMRRLQIQRKVGDPCDPTIEEWLGCKD